MKIILFAVGCAVTSLSLSAQSVAVRSLEISSNHARLGVASDWTQHHVLFPAPKSLAVMTQLQNNPRYTQSWLLHHREIWWPEVRRGRLRTHDAIQRDWSEPLGFTGPAYNISSITQSGTTVTVTTVINHLFIPGQTAMISGVSSGAGGCSSGAAAAIDGVQTITAATGYSKTFTFTSSQTATIADTDCTITNAAAVGPTPFEPVYDFSFNVGNESLETGFGSLNTFNRSDENIPTGSNTFYAGYLSTFGTLTLTDNSVTGAPLETYQLLGPDNFFISDDDLLFPNYPTTTLPIDLPGFIFTDSSPTPNQYQLLIYLNSVTSDYDFETEYFVGEVYKTNAQDPNAPIVLNFNNDPGGGQSYPAKYTFDVTATPSCTGDYVAMGIPANAVPGAQANIVGYNNLYAGSSPTGFCTGTAPKVKFAYASGTGEVPGSVSLSTNGEQLAYIEDLLAGSSVFHVLTIGTGSDEGTSPTDPVTPGTGASNAVDRTLSLSGGSGSCAAQSSTTSPFIDYADNTAYVTTYAWTGAGTGTGCLYKIDNVFGGTAPTIAWSVRISAVPSGPVWDFVSKDVFFTDSSGNIDYVKDTGTPSAYASLAVAAGTTSENPVIVDGTDEMVYATFNTNGTDALVAQAPINTGGTLGIAVSVPVGLGNRLFTGPYGVNFSNAWYANGPKSTGALLYVAGTDTTTGMVPTLYNVGFNTTTGVMETTANSSTPLATSTNAVTGAATVADASNVTEFYNATTGKDYLFVGVTDSCAATTDGGLAGCVMGLDITSGAPTVSTITTAIQAQGGSTGIVVDNEANATTYPQAASVYYGTKDGGTLVKVTQNGLE